MKKNLKKIIPMVAIVALMGTSVFANNQKNTDNIVKEQSDAKENTIYIDGELLQNVNLIEENGKTLMPVRAIFEKLGYEIEYNAEHKIITMTKGPHYITFSTTADAYTFSKMAPQPLGNAPVVKEGVTYVPIGLFELMGMEVELTSNNVLYIGEQSKEESDIIDRKLQTIITEIDEKNNTVTVDDDELGTVVLNIKNSKIEYTTQDKELIIGQALDVEYGDIMTKSLPPVNTPKSIKVVDKFSYGEVLNVEKDDKNNTRVLFNDEEMGEVVLILSPDFKLENQVDVKEIKKGQTLEVVLGNAMTMSLPPINSPKSVKLLDSKQVEEDDNEMIKGNATIKSFDKEEKTILVVDEKIGEVVLNLNEDLKIEHKNGSNINEYNWIKEGQKLEVEYSPIMTRSLPPVNNPVKITVLN
ncbi:stalk domain-containing protein [uncultured Tyzzerella sp.]|uniref:stalk domain-containing protein n=1 Tax=uncultured Tyzzerella sp. TaxID=2321398 RepID=UPI002942DBA8|nr:stalk domain-containing protein [uncultured Tyzzerella sp.]